MAKFAKKKEGDLPAVSTASLPDIVFMLLFFFMTVTTMKDSSLLVENQLPNANQIKKLEKKDRVIYIYVGKPTREYVSVFGEEPYAPSYSKGSFGIQRNIFNEPRPKSVGEVLINHRCCLRRDNTYLGNQIKLIF